MSVLSFAPPPALFKCKIVVEIIPYYHTAKLSSFAWIDWSRAFYFRICFGITLVFRFWWKAYTKRCTNSYLISRVKRLSSVALYGWSSAFKFRIRFKKRKSAVKTNILNQKYLVKNSEPPLPFFENRQQKPWFCQIRPWLCSSLG